LGAVDCHTEPELFRLISNMVEDFESHWGDPIVYSAGVVRVSMNRQQGIPKYAYWAAVLDPRTKSKTLRVLNGCEKHQVWSDIQQVVLHIAESSEDVDDDKNNANNNNQHAGNGAAAASRGPATFLCSPSVADDHSSSDDAGLSLVAVIAFKVSMFQRDKGCSLVMTVGSIIVSYNGGKLMFPSILICGDLQKDFFVFLQLQLLLNVSLVQHLTSLTRREHVSHQAMLHC
jgi:hypothetical protein